MNRSGHRTQKNHGRTARRRRSTDIESGTEQPLLAGEDPLRYLLEGVNDFALVLLNSAGHVSSWNPGAERTKGYRADQIIGRHFSVFYPPEEVEAGKPLRDLEKVVADGRS